ncbi:MAG: phosphatase PAP2 family protein, partial [Caldimonas sp.]
GATLSLFGAIAADIVVGGPLAMLDIHVERWLHGHAPAYLMPWMLAVTRLNSTFAIACYATLLGVLAFTRRQWLRLTTLAFCVAGGLLLNDLMKLAFHRARPAFDDPILTLTTYSFPSGHAAASTIFYALGVAWAFGQTRVIRWRALAVIGAALLISLVGFSRMVLGVHYLSDVVAGVAEGLFWVTLCLGALARLWPRPVAPR